MSTECSPGADIAPPPRAKRASLPRKTTTTNNQEKAIATPNQQSIQENYESAKNNVISSTNTPQKPPKPPNVITTSKIMTAPPPCNNDVRKLDQNNENEELHIYEAVDFRRNNKSDGGLRLSTDVQCWPWPQRQASLPSQSTPSSRSGKVTASPPSSAIAKSIQSGLRSVSLGRGCEGPRPFSPGQNQQRSNTIFQRFSSFRR